MTLFFVELSECLIEVVAGGGRKEGGSKAAAGGGEYVGDEVIKAANWK